MAQKMKGNIPEIEWLFRQEILRAKVGKIRGYNYCIHHLNDLQELKPKRPIEEKGEIEFTAKAEIHFVPKDKGGVCSSSGEGLKFGGVVKWMNGCWTLVDQLIIEDSVNTTILKRWVENEQGDL